MLFVILTIALISVSFTSAYLLSYYYSIDYDVSILVRAGFVRVDSVAFNQAYTITAGITTIRVYHMGHRGWFVTLWCPERNYQEFRLGDTLCVSSIIRLAQSLRGIQ